LGYTFGHNAQRSRLTHTRRSSPADTVIADLESVELSLEVLDRAVSGFEILVETVTLRNELYKQSAL
jgi:hypothetical protein